MSDQPDARASLPHPGVGDGGGRVYSYTLDRLRLLAIIEIIAFHIDTSKERIFLGMGLPFFLLTTVLMGVQRREAPPTRLFLGTRAQRLLMPWAAWSLVYVCLAVLRSIERGEAPGSRLTWWMLLGGGGVHLWFLPFAFVACAVAHLVHREIPHSRPILMGAVAGSMAVAAFGLQAFTRGGEIVWPIAQWIFSLPAIGIGMLLASGMARQAGARWACWGGAIGVLLIIAISGALSEQAPESGFRYLLASLLIIVAITRPGSRDPFTLRLTRLGYGIFLSHVAIIYCVHFAERRAGVSIGFFPELVIVCILSALLSMLMLRSSILRRFV